MSVKRQAKGIKWPWLIISPKEYLCWQSTGKGSYKREQNSLKHTNKSNLLKLICIRGCGPLSKNTNVDSSNPNKPYVVYQEKSFSAGNALAGSSRKIESEIWLLGQRTSNPSACLLMPQQLRHDLKAWESWETIFSVCMSPPWPCGFIFLSCTFFSGVLHDPDPSLAHCQPFPGWRGRRTLQKGKQVGMSSRFSDELSFGMKQRLPHT